MLTGTGRRDCSPGWRRAVLVSSGRLSGRRVGESGQVCALDRSQRASVMAEDLRCAHAGPHRRKGASPRTLQPTFKLPNRTANSSHGGSQRPGNCPRTNYATDRCASPHANGRMPGIGMGRAFCFLLLRGRMQAPASALPTAQGRSSCEGSITRESSTGRAPGSPRTGGKSKRSKTCLNRNSTTDSR
jgi:hypothetical protein